MINKNIKEVLETVSRRKSVIFSFPDEQKKMTGEELFKNVKEVEIALLGLKLKKGDHIGLLMENRSEWILLALAAGALGIVIVPINVEVSERSLSYFMDKGKIKVLFCSAEYKGGILVKIVERLFHENQKFHEIESVFISETNKYYNIGKTWRQFMRESKNILINELHIDNAETWIMHFTSGTTSLPKAVPISQFSALNVAKSYGRILRLNDNDTILQVLPYFHCVGSILGVLPTILFENKTIILKKFEPTKAVAYLLKEMCTVILGVPTIYLSMINCPSYNSEKMNFLRIVGIGGVGCPSKIFDLLSRKFPYSKIMCAYGLTETSSMILAPALEDDYQTCKNSVGRPIEGVNLKIDYQSSRESGELLVKGYCVLKSYIEDDDRTREAIDSEGWFHTGDIAQYIENGCVKILGRMNDMIEKAGEKISPQEVEAALYEVIENANLCVIGVPDSKYGEEIIAFVETSQVEEIKGKIIDEYNEINKKVLEKIMKFELPKFIVFVSEFPRTQSGKIRKGELRKLFEKGKMDKIMFNEQQI